MSNQIIITSGAKVRSLEGVLTGTSGVVNSLPINTSNGIPQLDSNGKILVSQLPNSVMEYKGTWNVATNTPYLVNGVGNQGDVYLVEGAATTGTSHDFGAGAITFYNNDQAIYSGSIWQRASGATGSVTSVGLSTNAGAITIGNSPITTSGVISANFNGTASQYVNGAGNLTTFPTLITSIGLSMPSAFSVANSPLTANGSINVTGAGTTSQYIDGTGALQTFPALTGYVPYTGATTDVDLGTHVLNAQALHVKGTAGAGHLGLKHQTASPTGSANESLIFADVNGNLGWQNDNLYLTTLVSNANTANRSYTFPNASGTLALTSDISYPVTSVFGRTGAVTAQSGDYTTTLVTEGTRLYYTDARARAALSFTAGSGAYNSTTGVITIPTNTSQLTNGANFITLASLSAGTGISYNNTTGVISSTITQYTDAMARAAISGGTGISYNSTTGVITNTITQYTDALARAAISLTTTGTSGAATYNSTTGVLNIPQYTDAYTGTVTSVAMTVPTGLSVSGSPITTSGTLAVTLTAGYSIPTTASQTNWDTAYTNRITSATSPLSITSNVISISQSTTSTSGYLSSTDWNTFNSKQGTITLTTTGSSGAATLVSNTLNIPNYTLSGLGGIGGSGTANYLPKFTAGTTIGNSLVQDNGSTVSIITGSTVLSLDRTGGATALIELKTGGTVRSYLGADTSMPFVFFNQAASPLMYLNASGNLGLGVTPDAWASAFKALQVGTASLSQNNTQTAYVGSNWVSESGGDKYITTAAAAIYAQNAGGHIWYSAPSGTAGTAISFTQAMTLNASGNLGVGIATPTERLHIYSSASSTEIRIENSTTSAYIRSQTDNLNFYFNGADRMRIFSNGNIGVGTTTDSGYKLDVNGTGRFSSSVTFAGGVYNYVGTNKFFAAASGSINYLYTGSSSLTILNQADSATLFTLANSGAATFSGAVTVGDNLSMNVGGQFYYGDPSTNRYLRTYVSGASGSATLNYAFWNGTAWVIKSTLDYNGAATFSSSVTSALYIVDSPTGNDQVVFKNNGSFDWQIGGKTGDATQNFSIYNYATATRALYFDKSSNAATFSSTTGASLTSVSSDFYASLTLQHTGGSNAGQWNIQSVSGTQIGASAGAAFGIYSNTASAYRFYINPSGNVGIGTTSPNAMLDVYTSQGGSTIAATHGTGGSYPKASGISFGATSTSLTVSNNGGTTTFTGGAGIYATNSAASNNPTDLVFWTTYAGSPTERMRITSGGVVSCLSRVLVNGATDDGSNALQVSGSIVATSTIAAVVPSNVDMFVFNNTGATYTKSCVVASMTATGGTGSYFFYGQQSTSTVALKIFSNGNIQNTNNSYGAISDVRLKENITDATPKLDDLLKVKVRNYNLKGEKTKQLGVISQELEEIFPNMIEESTNLGENVKIKGVKYSVFVPMLIKAVQEQQEQINELKQLLNK